MIASRASRMGTLFTPELRRGRCPLARRMPFVLTSMIVAAVGKYFAGVAQLVEHLICNQRVRGSNPFASSKQNGLSGSKVASCNH